MNHGPCNWTVDICQDCCSTVVSGLDPGLVEAANGWAVDFLWKATGRRYGLCEETYRPCRQECADSSIGGLGFPFAPTRTYGGSWVNLSCRTCPGACGCGAELSEVYLPGTYAVTGIVVDGESLDPLTTVMVYDNSRIIRADGSQWPACQDLSLPSDAVSGAAGTWQITILRGLPVPDGGALAAGLLACEFLKACVGADDCRLPKRVQTITRQGVTVGFQDMFEGLSDLRTGIWEIDAFLEAARTARWTDPVIASPDVPTHPQLTFPGVGFTSVSVFDGGSP